VNSLDSRPFAPGSRTLCLVACLLAVSSPVHAVPSNGNPTTRERAAETCKPLPRNVRIKVSLKPDTDVADLIAWYATLTCTPLVVSGTAPVAGKKVTILSPQPVTLAEIEQLFLGALESAGLTIERDGKFTYVIDAARARYSKTPVVPRFSP
jgi:type II secretory pathway component GspD/PulD (secretin)